MRWGSMWLSKASDTPRWVIRMELEGPAVGDGHQAGGMAGQGPGPLVLRWTDQDVEETLAAD